MPETQNLNALCNDELLFRTRALTNEERRITAEVLRHLEEIESRRLHLTMSYPSLFEFCMRELGFSEGQAHRRISAMRLAREIPEVRSAVESGRLSLSNVAQAQKFFRGKKKSGETYSIEQKRSLLKNLETKSSRECERELAALAPEQARTESLRPISQNESRLNVTLGSETIAHLERLKDLWSHSGEMSYSEIIAKLAKQGVLKLEQSKASRPSKKANTIPLATSQPSEGVGQSIDEDQAAPRAPLSRTSSRYIPRSIVRHVWHRDGGKCSFINPDTQKRCNSSHALQVDHIEPFALGGAHVAENLRLLCR